MCCTAVDCIIQSTLFGLRCTAVDCIIQSTLFLQHMHVFCVNSTTPHHITFVPEAQYQHALNGQHHRPHPPPPGIYKPQLSITDLGESYMHANINVIFYSFLLFL